MNKQNKRTYLLPRSPSVLVPEGKILLPLMYNVQLIVSFVIYFDLFDFLYFILSTWVVTGNGFGLILSPCFVAPL